MARSTKSHLSVTWDVDEPFVEVVKRDSETTNITLQYLDPLPLGFRVQYLGTKFDIDILSPRQRELMKFMKEKEKLDTSKLVLSPMPGTIVSVAVSAGDVVAEGAEVAVVEAMKMQNVLRAPRAGTIKAVHVKPGSTVSGEDILIELEDEK
ncbi:single hybrid motif-containing protein [Linderina pennispora]|uniref:Single hybrid motif-containing protein n=1 Tax=Linderina pennispora TaxID=61395 RepID=A0A1Y1VWR8_9FUNG|nr:single hybrid motif-containing protein [Linderina pennispora]ORX65653.1 single hybrid motif-containing protein [Linderina pennispora]